MEKVEAIRIIIDVSEAMNRFHSFTGFPARKYKVAEALKTLGFRADEANTILERMGFSHSEIAEGLSIYE